MKVLYGIWRKDLKGLTEVCIRDIKVLKNETDKTIVYSPSGYLCGGLESQEIVLLPGQVACYTKQAVFHDITQVESFVVVGSEPEVRKFVECYFFDPQSAEDIDVCNGVIRLMKVPLSMCVLHNYSDATAAGLFRILKDRGLYKCQQPAIDRFFRTARS